MLTAAAFALSLFAAQAATTIGTLPNAPLINSQNTTQTNTSFGSTTNGIWPNFIPPSTIVTNVTKVSTTGGKDVAIQFSAAPLGANDNSNIVVQIGRNISGDAPTNAAGTGCRIEWFATLTNQLSLVAGQQTTVCYLYGAANATTYGDVPGDGACTTFYVNYINVPALTTLTNYQIFVNSQ